MGSAARSTTPLCDSSHVPSVNGAEAVVLDYVARPGAWDVMHTYADPAFRGTGAASRLVQHVFDEARTAHLKIIPSCPYIPVWVSRPPDSADLVRPAG